MATFVYLGMTEKDKKAMLEARIKGMKPQDKRGEEFFYTIKTNDPEPVKEEKRKRTAKWLADRKKEIEADIEGLSQKITFAGVEFPTGKEVTVDDYSHAAIKINAILGAKGKKERPMFKAVEKAAKEEKAGPGKIKTE